MNIHKDAIEFGNLCTDYREAVKHKKDSVAADILKDIKQLIIYNAERLALKFRLAHATKTKIDKKRGIALAEATIEKKINKPNLTQREITTLNPFSQDRKIAMNILIDYSGSMWFPRNNTIDGLKRIYAANFIALTTSTFIQLNTNKKFRINIVPFCKTPIIHKYNNEFINDSWDTMIVHKGWASGSHSEETPSSTPLLHKTQPNALPDNSEWFCNEYPSKAIKESLQTFKKEKYSGFINVIITDGGIHRIGESHQDRMKFLERMCLYTLQLSNQNQETVFLLIKEQTPTTRQILKKTKINHITINTQQEFNHSLIYLQNITNTIMRKGQLI